MEKWVEHDGRYIDGDVLRWKQPIWSSEGPRQSKKDKVTKVGERRLTAQFLLKEQVLPAEGSGPVRMTVLKDEILSNEYKMPLKVHKKDSVVVKKRTTISKGSPERLTWPDEGGRSWAIATSRFF